MTDVRTRAGLRRAATRALAVFVGAAGLVVAPSASPAGAQAVPFDYADTAGVDVQGTPAMVDFDGWMPGHQPDPRLWDVTMVSPSIFVGGTNPAPPPAVDPVQIPIKTRIHLPDGYDHGRAAGYPVLYLLHGGAGAWQDWSLPDDVNGYSCASPVSSPGGGDITEAMDAAPTDVITVMVEGGCAGWYADWQGETDGNFRPLWETFHTQQLVPWVDANLNTQADRAGRAIAGVSMGGLGATRYAAHRDDLFGAVGSFSGAVEMRHEPMQDTVSNSMWAYGATVHTQGFTQTEYRMTTGEPPEQEETTRMNMLFGTASPPVAPETRPGWPTMNPVELAEGDAFDSYGADDVALYSGAHRRDAQGEVLDEGEEDIAVMNDALHDALEDSGVDARYCRGFGTHAWSYWQADLADFLHVAFGTTPATCPNGYAEQ